MISNREAFKSTLKIFLFNLSLPEEKEGEEEEGNMHRLKCKLQVTSFLTKYQITNC